MKIKLKHLTINARNSQETTAFAADVWVDGKRVGYATNDGHGGCTAVLLDPSVEAAVEAYGKAVVPAKYKRLTGGAEWIVDRLVDAELAKKLAKKLARKNARKNANAATCNGVRS